MPGIINKQRAQRLIASFSSPEQVSAALGELRAHWEGCSLSTPSNPATRS